MTNSANENKAKIIALGGKEWQKNGMDRVYIDCDILNTLSGEMGLCDHLKFGERNNKIFFDVATNEIMRSYKGKKPKTELKLS